MPPRVVAAADLDLSRGSVRGLVSRGQWVVLARGVYLTSPGPPTWLDRVTATALATGGVASYTTAARIHGFGVTPLRDPIHVTVPSAAGRRQRRGIRLHFQELASDDVSRSPDGLPLTTPLRTALDCARILPSPEAVAAVEAAMRAGADVSALPARLVALADPRSESALETRVRLLLTLAGLPPPDVQWDVDVRGRRYRLDLAYPAAMLAVEVDGRAHHSDHVDFQRDRRRQNDLVLSGWTVLRFTADDVARRPAAIVAAVRLALEVVVA